ncbi:hypothetical protein TRFO_34186 [Tritrichomonas foetus]|uniref:Uncharacterized protein n=1 Tax=Tritrichomonas foetus TaxID=1144522 RepID=A0A1J4JJN7_9EUKA|nr:hypothetical protein TRFO_34186 [Tritrichomonas foetus]|eukprot:OHS99374.1 hypothetical protein TRFO_34186 [Tritrichomonas foetus]
MLPRSQERHLQKTQDHKQTVLQHESEDGTFFPTLKFNQEFQAEHSEFLKQSYDHLSSNLNSKLAGKFHYYEVNRKLIDFLKSDATKSEIVGFPYDTDFLAELFSSNIDTFLEAQTTSIPNDRSIVEEEEKQTKFDIEKLQYFDEFMKLKTKEAKNEKGSKAKNKEEFDKIKEKEETNTKNFNITNHNAQDHSPDNSLDNKIKPINKIFLVFPQWNMLIPLLDSFKRKSILKKIDITFEIFRQENIFEDPKSLFTICKARQELKHNYYNQSLISCQNICPFKEDYADCF